MIYRKKKPCIEDRKDEIIQMLADGRKPSEIARKLGVSRKGVVVALARWGECKVEPTNFMGFIKDKDEVIQARLSGTTRVEMAFKWSVNPSTVTKYLAAWGYPFDKVPEVDDELILDLRAGGLSMKEIAEKAGVSTSTISRVVNRSNLRKSIARKLPPVKEVPMPSFKEGVQYLIEKKEYVFQRMLKARRPMAVFLDSHGRTTTFTDLQLIGIKEVEMNAESERGA